ncbi:hypothetical protein [Thioclava indica]|uniref:Uncharacterized protein n=1 Tax=Thioclava indica TaxID=1353528 RepID=A0A074JWE3_9RHOB|nr:hypothetical protein [Thioclava indica]KEO59923.1 hypothetical protein DT23_15415 [Thioclava indica]
MTTTTAEHGVTPPVVDTQDHAHDTAHVNPRIAYLIAFVTVALAVGLIATMGLGGLILWGVGATWIMLALLVLMTAGG